VEPEYQARIRFGQIADLASGRPNERNFAVRNEIIQIFFNFHIYLLPLKINQSPFQFHYKFILAQIEIIFIVIFHSCHETVKSFWNNLKMRNYAIIMGN